MVQVCNNQQQENNPTTRISRSAMRRRLQRRTKQTERMRRRIAELKREVSRLKKQFKYSTQQLQLVQTYSLEQSCMNAPMTSPRICLERPLPGHQFGVTLIATAINLAKRVGFRAAAAVMRIMFDALGIDQKVPSHDAIEQWTLRLGVSALESPFSKDQPVLWISDHSSQIGKEKILLIIGIALDDLPPPGQALQLENMKVLAVVPGTSWKKEDVEREYRMLAERIGPPVYLLCDGATELRDPAEKLEKDGKTTIVFGDLKHYAANVLEKEIGRSERFKSFMSEAGLTRNRVQQTELSHLAPPTLRKKSRFMNLGSLLNWASMVLYHLDHPSSPACVGISVERMQEKLGWLTEFADELNQWRACQEVIDHSLEVINHNGLDSNTPAALDQVLRQHDTDWRKRNTAASRIGRRMIEWIEQSADKLVDGKRGWLSSEILESLFGHFKQLERQHSRGGYTRLIAALPTLCMSVTGEAVREGFKRVDSRALREWLRESLPVTLTARRNAAYLEYYRTKSCDQFISAA